MAERERQFHFLIEGRDGLQFFWNLVFSGSSLDEARSRLVRYFQIKGLDLIGFDDEETREVDLTAVPPAWLAAGKPDVHLVAAGGRIWVGPSKAVDDA